MERYTDRFTGPYACLAKRGIALSLYVCTLLALSLTHLNLDALRPALHSIREETPVEHEDKRPAFSRPL